MYRLLEQQNKFSTDFSSSLYIPQIFRVSVKVPIQIIQMPMFAPKVLYDVTAMTD
jgi:hypothetical protein